MQATYQKKPAVVRNRIRRFSLHVARYLMPGPIGSFLHYAAWLKKFSSWLGQQDLPAAHASRTELYEQLISDEALDAPIDYLEFGVAYGDSMRWWTDRLPNTDARFHGFDTFTGLPEQWGPSKVGAFSNGGNTPDIDDSRIQWHVGLFSDTLPDFLENRALDRRLVIHLDADLFSSTLFVLTQLATRLKPGDILLFDELGSVRLPYTEFRGFQDFVEAYGLEYELLGTTTAYQQVAMRVKTTAILEGRRRNLSTVPQRKAS